VGDHDHGRAGRATPLEDVHHRFAVGAVEIAGRLVGEDQVRLGGERAGDGDALLLAAGKLLRAVAGAVAEPTCSSTAPTRRRRASPLR
jgi:hypothetical protein